MIAKKSAKCRSNEIIANGEDNTKENIKVASRVGLPL